jgi:hypothetical protein
MRLRARMPCHACWRIGLPRLQPATTQPAAAGVDHCARPLPMPTTGASGRPHSRLPHCLRPLSPRPRCHLTAADVRRGIWRAVRLRTLKTYSVTRLEALGVCAAASTEPAPAVGALHAQSRLADSSERSSLRPSAIVPPPFLPSPALLSCLPSTSPVSGPTPATGCTGTAPTPSVTPSAFYPPHCSRRLAAASCSPAGHSGVSPLSAHTSAVHPSIHGPPRRSIDRSPAALWAGFGFG